MTNSTQVLEFSRGLAKISNYHSEVSCINKLREKASEEETHVSRNFVELYESFSPPLDYLRIAAKPI